MIRRFPFVMRQMPDILREVRRAAGLTQKELAKRSGINARTISSMEAHTLMPAKRGPWIGAIDDLVRACGGRIIIEVIE